MIPSHLAHAISARPRLYDAIQAIAGSRICYSHLRAMLPPTAGKRVLDVGGGTGISKDSLDSTTEYTVADIDVDKLLLLRRKHASALAIQADAASLPVRTAGVDVGLLVFVCHHLDDATLEAVLGELARVCSGPVLVMDPIWAPRRLRGRVLWRYDEGRHPRTVLELGAAVRRRFVVDAEDAFAVHHEYHIWRCEPRRARTGRAQTEVPPRWPVFLRPADANDQPTNGRSSTSAGRRTGDRVCQAGVAPLRTAFGRSGAASP